MWGINDRHFYSGQGTQRTASMETLESHQLGQMIEICDTLFFEAHFVKNSAAMNTNSECHCIFSLPISLRRGFVKEKKNG